MSLRGQQHERPDGLLAETDSQAGSEEQDSPAGGMPRVLHVEPPTSRKQNALVPFYR